MTAATTLPRTSEAESAADRSALLSMIARLLDLEADADYPEIDDEMESLLERASAKSASDDDVTARAMICGLFGADASTDSEIVAALSELIDAVTMDQIMARH